MTMRLLGLSATFIAGFAAIAPASAVPFLPDFGAATFVPGAPIDNPFLPLTSGQVRVYQSTDPSVDEGFEQRVLGAGPTVLGVQTTTLLDRAFADGLLVEYTLDYFAQDSVGNVWYFGEYVTNFHYDASDNLIGTDHAGSWLAGANGALPGFAMPALQVPGQNYYQEFAPADGAVDEGTTLNTNFAFTTLFGSSTGILGVFEATALDPTLREVKFYLPGVGLVREAEDVDENFGNPGLTVDLVEVRAVPEPASWAMLLGGFGLAGAALRRRRAKWEPGTTQSGFVTAASFRT